MRDDVIQDTALRLYGMWMRVENDRSAWPLTKTIALNLVRDASRRRGSVEIALEIPDLPAPHDVESSGIARMELRRIEKALREMSPAHRSLLLEEIGQEPASVATSPAAEKMMRMRARKRLIALLEKVSALIPWKHARFMEWGSGLVTARDGLAGGFACFLCVVLGTGLVVVAPGVTEPAKARPQRVVAAPTLETASLTTPNGRALDSAVNEAYAFTAAVRKSGGRGSIGASATGRKAKTGESGPGSEPLPIPDEVPGTGVHVDPDDVSGVAPPPDTPEPKTGFEQTIEELVETTEGLLDTVGPRL
jgi:hypothetical protein